MATGIQSSDSKRVTVVRLVENATAANGVPVGAPTATPAAGVGFDLNELKSGNVLPDWVSVRIYETAGSGVMTLASARLWGFSLVSGKWTPLGIGGDTTKGLLNSGSTFGETGTDQLRHQEPLMLPGHLDGVYIELGTIAGAATALSVEIDFPRHTVK